MGCDIHDFIEVRTKDGWRAVEHSTVDRSYATFAMLGNVRNDDRAHFNYIGDCRGFPDDVTDPPCALAWRFGNDGHSHSYVTLRELLDFDPDQTADVSGYVDSVQYDAFKRLGMPTHNTQYVQERFVVSNEQMEGVIFGTPNVYTKVSWTIKHSDAAPQIWSKLIPAMQKYTNDNVGPDDVRLVFFFDN